MLAEKGPDKISADIAQPGHHDGEKHIKQAVPVVPAAAHGPQIGQAGDGNRHQDGYEKHKARALHPEAVVIDDLNRHQDDAINQHRRHSGPSPVQPEQERGKDGKNHRRAHQSPVADKSGDDQHLIHGQTTDQSPVSYTHLSPEWRGCRCRSRCPPA